jgi:hypothetical protein
VDTTPSPAPAPNHLKLRAIDQDDLSVIAAFLQDSIAGVAEMAYLPEESRFVLVVSRFRWERVLDASPEDVFERVSCAITVEAAQEPKYRGFSLTDRSRMMPLLTVTFDDRDVVLTFGGDAAVKLKVDRLDLRMEDFGSGWPTKQKPEHGSTR